MIELPDDELDKLFRKSSEEFDPNYEPKDWNALSRRLDREDGKTPAAWFRKWWPAVILALLIPAGLAGYYWINSADSNKRQITQSSSPKIISPEPVAVPKPESEKPVPGSKVKEPLASAENVPQNNAPESGNKSKSIGNHVEESNEETTEKAGLDKNEVSKILPRSRSKAGGVYLEPNRSKGKEGDGAFSSIQNKPLKQNRSVIRRNEIGDENITENQFGKNSLAGKKPAIVSDKSNDAVQDAISILSSKNLAAKDQDITTKEAEDRLLLSVSALDHLPFNKKTALQFPAITWTQTETIEPPKQVKQNEPSPKLAIRFGYSPDMSSVGLKNFSKPGSAFSLMVEYGLSRRLYLQTGVVRSEKVYFADSSEYEWPADWKTGPRAISTDATCKIIEIPLNLRYDLIQNNRFRVFAGAGMSSYHMQNEKYVYNYAPHTYNIKWKDYETKTGWYLLSHVNLSAGYEHRISNKLSLLAEPYVKIPIKKVGYGKVDLFTAGVWLSIRYTPVFK